MEAEQFRALMSADGLRLLDALGEPGSSVALDDPVRAVSTLRAQGHPADLVAAVLSQARLRRRAAAKFGPFAAHLLFTEAGLEQATRLGVAAVHAGRFRDGGVQSVADLGCGIGADALAVAGLGLEVIAVERDEVTAAVAAFNLAPFSNARVEHADAEAFAGSDAFSRVDGVWLDPARRDARRRLRDPDDWSPSLDFAFEVARRRPTGVKLAPGLDRELVPDDAEAQWVSAGGEVVEVALWFGPLAREGVRRSALLVGEGGSHELTAAADSDDVAAGALGDYLYEPDGAVIRARLIGDVARSVDGRMLDPTIAYITSDERRATPFATRFAVDARVPIDLGALRRELRARDIGTLEIKKRGADIDPAQFRRSLQLRGSASATLIVTRLGGERVALLVHRDPDDQVE